MEHWYISELNNFVKKIILKRKSLANEKGKAIEREYLM